MKKRAHHFLLYMFFLLIAGNLSLAAEASSSADYFASRYQTTVSLSGFSSSLSDSQLSIASGAIGNQSVSSASVDLSGLRAELFIYVIDGKIQSSGEISSGNITPLYLLQNVSSGLNIIDFRPQHPTKQKFVIEKSETVEGVTDQSIFSSALNVARSLGNLEVIVKSDRYLLTGNLSIPSNTRLVFYKPVQILLDNPAASQLFNSNGTNNVSIVGGAFSVSQRATPSKLISLFLFSNCTNLKLQNLLLSDLPGHGIFIDGIDSVEISNVYIKRVTNISLEIKNATKNVKVNNVRVEDSGFLGIEIKGISENQLLQDFSVEKTIVLRSKKSNISLYYAKNGRVCNVTSSDSLEHFGVLAIGLHDTTFINCTFNGNTAGLLLNEGSSGNKVRSIVADNNREDGVDIAYHGGHHNIIENSKMRSNGIWGVYLNNARSNIVRNNKITDNGYQAARHSTFGSGIQIDSQSSSNQIYGNNYGLLRSDVQRYSVYISPDSLSNDIR